MDEGIKRKLVGVAVLVVVGLIVLPQVTTKTQNAEYLAKSVPIEADIPQMDMPLPKSMDIAGRDVVPVNEVEQKVIDLPSIEVDGKTIGSHQFEIPEPDLSGQNKVWQIQVASFAQPKNALSLRNRLRSDGFKAFERQSVDGAYTRVFIGPTSQKKTLEKKLIEIKSKYALQGKIIPYVGK